MIPTAEKFNTLTDVEDTTSFDGEGPPLHININHVEKIGDNEFSVQAYLTEIFNETGDYFNEKFKSYAESMYDLQPLFENTSISVRPFNASLSEFENDTSVWFVLKTFEIQVLDTDLDMSGNFTIFDDIFEKFNLDEFKAHFSEVEGESEIADDGEQATTFADISTETFDETTYIDSTTDRGGDYTEAEAYEVVDDFGNLEIEKFFEFNKKIFILDDETEPAQFKRRVDVHTAGTATSSSRSSLKCINQSILLLITLTLVQ